MRSIFDKEDTSLINELCNLFRSCGSVEFPDKSVGMALYKAHRANSNSNKSKGSLRASSISNPVIVQVLDALYPEDSPTFTLDTVQKLTDGVITNTYVEMVLSTMGYNYQDEVKLGYCNISGHADFIVINDDTREMVVIEVKSMASHLVSKFVKVPNDHYGYLSQLSFYHGACQLSFPDYNVKGLFLIKDRGMCTWNPVKINDIALESRFQNVRSLVEVTKGWELMNFGEVYDTFPIPPVEEDMIPVSMKFSRWHKALYQQIEGTPMYMVASKQHYMNEMIELCR